MTVSSRPPAFQLEEAREGEEGEGGGREGACLLGNMLMPVGVWMGAAEGASNLPAS